MSHGNVLMFPAYRVGKDSAPPPTGIVKVGRPVAERCRYIGHMVRTEDYGVVALFVDEVTGLLYGQPVEG